jgi:eukaryotic-like serine/threonine-protein kinase
MPPPVVSLLRANPARTGAYAGPGLKHMPTTVWTYTIPSPLSLIISPPVVSGPLVYVVTSDGILHALRTASGVEDWQGNAHLVSPSLADGILYFSWQGMLYAVNAADRAALWRFPTGRDIESSPVVADGVVYVGSDDGYLYAIEAHTGQLKWKFSAGARVMSDPAVANGVIYFTGQVQTSPAGVDHVDFAGHIYALDSANGELKWTFKPPGDMQTPVVADGMVYSVRASDAAIGPAVVYALDGRSGKVIWQQSPEPLLSTLSVPVVANGYLYTGSDRTGTLYALDARTGKQSWAFGRTPQALSPSVVGSIVYFGSPDNTLYALDGASGQLQWKLATPSEAWAPPVFDGKTLYVATERQVFALR